MKTEDQAFEKAYKELNVQQREAVDCIEGPVMVIAGPGTGKTQILALRIARILTETDTAPEQVLALTFTESGATAMRERLHRYIGAAAYHVPIYTFHGLAGMVIREYPDAFPAIIGGRPASELEKVSLIEEILENTSIKVLRPLGAPEYYIKPILSEIATLKREYITPDNLATIITHQEEVLAGTEKTHEKGAHKGKVRSEYQKLEKNIIKNKELLYVYRAYNALLRERRLFDFDDMVVELVRALTEDEALLRDLQESYQYILADEHQDVNGSQNNILKLLASFHTSPNIFVVGDEKQAIYRFQGASLENFLYFEDAFPGTKTIALTDNYRSGQTVLDAAHTLVAVEEGPLKELRVPLLAQNVKDSDVLLHHFSHQEIEDSFVVSEIEKEIASGVPPEEIAVILRTNKEVESFATRLRQKGVAAAASADGDILSHPITRGVETLIEAVVRPEKEDALFTVLHGPYWGITAADLVKVLGARRYDMPLATIISDTKALQSLGLADVDAVLRVGKTLASLRGEIVTESAHRVLARILEETGFLTYAEAHEPTESARVIRRLYDEVERMVVAEQVCTLEDALRQLRALREHHLSLDAPYINTENKAVSVLTAHKAKGLEFASVYIPHLTDTAWGGRKRPRAFQIPITKHIDENEFSAEDDERRLLYVAMTRAKKHLVLSHAAEGAEGRAFSPSRLLDDICEAKVETPPSEVFEKEFAALENVGATRTAPVLNADFITGVLKERGFSATSLNNYLRSPWDYVYRNALRIPEVQPLHMQFGTALHDVLERMTREHTASGILPEVTAYKRYLETSLGRLPLTTDEYTRLHQKALEALTVYREHLSKILPKKTEEEFTLRVLFKTGVPELLEIPLTGKLDRLDFSEDGALLQVVDYKTGKPKTRGYIEGKTKDSDGGYKRQLTFYALLLSLYEHERYTTRTATLSFIEPDSKGNIREEVFEISEADVNALKGEIVNAVKEITSGTFLEVPCDPSVSSYCDLVELLLRSEEEK